MRSLARTGHLRDDEIIMKQNLYPLLTKVERPFSAKKKWKNPWPSSLKFKCILAIDFQFGLNLLRSKRKTGYFKLTRMLRNTCSSKLRRQSERELIREKALLKSQAFSCFDCIQAIIKLFLALKGVPQVEDAQIPSYTITEGIHTSSILRLFLW